MPPLGRRRDADEDRARSRELVVSNEPIVTADSYVVLVDLAVRYDQVLREDRPALAWDPANEAAISAVAVTTLRVEGEKSTRDEVMAARALLADPIGKALGFAPVPAGFRPTVVSLEVRAHDPEARRTGEFRVVG